MNSEVVSYSTPEPVFTGFGRIKHADSENGIKCNWKQYIRSDNNFRCEWFFNWQTLKKNDADRVEGSITVTITGPDFDTQTHQFLVHMNEPSTTILKIFDGFSESQLFDAKSSFSYEFTVYYNDDLAKLVQEMSLPSGKTDVVLVVEEKKLHFNKTFLSLHSEFFNGLFSQNWREAGMPEIEIHEISLKDFAAVMGVIHVKPVFPTDATVKNILRDARRFLMPAVSAHVEQYLLFASRLDDATKLVLADEFGLKTLLEKCIPEFRLVEKLQMLKGTEGFQGLSQETKAKIFDHFVVNV